VIQISANHQINSNQVVTGVSGHSVIIKNIVLPPMSREELEESIDWHAEEHIPYDLADVTLDYHVTAENANRRGFDRRLQTRANRQYQTGDSAFGKTAGRH
jgi:type IV pilus assembly protein PilM